METCEGANRATAVDRKPGSSPAGAVLSKSGFLEVDMRLRLFEDCCQEPRL